MAQRSLSNVLAEVEGGREERAKWISSPQLDRCGRVSLKGADADGGSGAIYAPSAPIICKVCNRNIDWKKFSYRSGNGSPHPLSLDISAFHGSLH